MTAFRYNRNTAIAPTTRRSAKRITISATDEREGTGSVPNNGRATKTNDSRPRQNAIKMITSLYKGSMIPHHTRIHTWHLRK